ncbi:MAG: NAD(P)H-hydrate dehydratase [Planctomycetota bacterium]|nr:MAG: NAD(P)H-hydrate dehydratase [Planctomycetota bacterium]
MGADPLLLPPLPARPKDAHKGSMGRVLLVAGARGMAGAAAMAAEAVLRGGAGYVLVATPGGVATELTVLARSAVLRLCGGPERAFLIRGDLDALLEEAGRSEAVAVGPGLGTHADTRALVTDFLPRLPAALPVLVDADGLNALAGSDWERIGLGPRAVLTPHPGEAARLLQWKDAAAVQARRSEALAELVGRSGATVVLKGGGTLVGAPGKEAWRNQTGNPGMATAGTGDVLTGLVAALLARGMSPWDAARLGVHLHGLAGDLAAAELGEESLIAPDLLHYLPQALRRHPRSPSA